MLRKDDCTVYCSCRRFEQFGLLCRHIFYVLRKMDIREFPKQYVLNRWRRDVVPNCSVTDSFSLGCFANGDSVAQAVMRDTIYAFEQTLNHLSGNLEELSRYKEYVKSYLEKAIDLNVVVPAPSKRDRFAEISGQQENDRLPIRVPVLYKSKGSGSHKRLKSVHEEAVEKVIKKSGKKERQCQNCKGYGHYASTCKQPVIKRRSTRSSPADIIE